MEFGPRALGARSILASPLHADMQARLNELKDREDFRPVAPAVLEEAARRLVRRLHACRRSCCSSTTCGPTRRARIPAACHADGTARVQTVSRAHNPLYHDLIAAFAQRTGVPVLINTSFNTRGKPIVCTPRDALECFCTSPLDVLAIGPYVIEKARAVNPRISVVIATYERPQLLLRCIDALLAQTLPGARFEIVIVDDGSSRATRERAMAALGGAPPPSPRADAALPVAADEPRTRPRRATTAFSRRAAASSRSPTTIRCRIPTGCERGSRRSRNGADAVAGGGRGAAARRADRLRARRGGPVARAGSSPRTASCAATLLAAVGGFDERFRSAWREDTDLCFRLRASGAIVRASHAARVVHPVRPARWGVSLAQQRKVMFDALLYKKFPHGYRRYVRPRPPWEYYARGRGGPLRASSTPWPACGCWRWRASPSGSASASRFASRRLANTSHAPRHVAEMIVTSLLIPWMSVYWRTRGALRYPRAVRMTDAQR